MLLEEFTVTLIQKKSNRMKKMLFRGVQGEMLFMPEALLKRFLDRYNPARLDENRLFTDEQKIVIFRRDQEKCQVCGKNLTFGNPDTQFHHKDKYIEGGRTEVEKGLLVCRDCHLNNIHEASGE